jgi:hypothetical protein
VTSVYTTKEPIAQTAHRQHARAVHAPFSPMDGSRSCSHRARWSCCPSAPLLLQISCSKAVRFQVQILHVNVPLLDIPKAIADQPYITDGRAFSGAKWPSCAAADEVCVPPMPAPFAECLMHEGDVLCPNGWNSRQVLYGAMDDQRFCTECSCLPSTGATCSMRVKVFSEATCSTSRLEVDISLDMGQDCFPIMVVSC